MEHEMMEHSEILLYSDENGRTGQRSLHEKIRNFRIFYEAHQFL